MDDQTYTPNDRGMPELTVHRSGATETTSHELAAQIVNINKLRDIYIDSSLFRNSAWDVFLSLYIKRQEGLRATPALLSAINRLPESECVKAIDELTDAGLAQSIAGEKGERPTVIELTDQGLQRVEAFLLSARRV